MIDTVTGSERMPRLSLPREMESPAKHPFPLLASLAPVVGSLVIWAITSSPFALVFAFLGPVIAIASMADARLQGRRSLRRERVRFERDATRLGDSIERWHDRERARRTAAAPGALAVLDRPVRDPERWRATLTEELPVTIGRGEVESALCLDGSSELEPLAMLVTTASVLRDGPVVVDARLGIGICGDVVLATAVARGILLQLAVALAPETATFAAGPHFAGLLGVLPHRVAIDDAPAAPGGLAFVTVGERGAATVIAIAATQAGLPARCRVVISLGPGRCARVASHPLSAIPGQIEPEFVSADQAAAIAAVLAEAAEDRRGMLGSLPASLSLSALHQTVGGASLPATFLADVSGAVSVDLVLSGPHAVIGGMTGSGKSELLVSWLLAIAALNPPTAVCFLLVDFKGGASFAPVAALPHVVGLVTDLDERSAHRALQSLSAEIRHRERAVAAAGVRSIGEPGLELPRLIIVVDEFAALVGGFHELHELFADLAARGRSLGIHLILCTQRPAGVVRDSVLANVPLRLSLRVNNRADSTAVVGTDAAAQLPAAPPGRAILAIDGADPLPVQVALATPDDARQIIERYRGAPLPRRPWRDDLPNSLDPSALERVVDGYPFGLLDLPDEQRQETAAWRPSTSGSLFVIGAGGSGKSCAVAAIRAAAVDSGEVAVTLVPAQIERAWDLVAKTVVELRRGTIAPLLLLFDDIDALLGLFGDEHQQPFVDLLLELLRSGAAAGVHLVLTARRTAGQVQALSAACDSRLLLRLQNRQDHLIAGGDAALFSSDAVPGRGEWRGRAVQVAAPVDGQTTVPMPAHPAARFDPAAWPVIAAISGRPFELAARLGTAAEVSRLGEHERDLSVGNPGRSSVIVGDVESWNSDWQRLSSLRATAPLLFDHCTVAEFRALSGQRRLPPPIAPQSDSAWLLQPGGALSRVTIATPEPPATPATPEPPRASAVRESGPSRPER